MVRNQISETFAAYHDPETGLPVGWPVSVVVSSLAAERLLKPEDADLAAWFMGKRRSPKIPEKQNVFRGFKRWSIRAARSRSPVMQGSKNRRVPGISRWRPSSLGSHRRKGPGSGSIRKPVNRLSGTASADPQHRRLARRSLGHEPQRQAMCSIPGISPTTFLHQRRKVVARRPTAGAPQGSSDRNPR